MPKLTHMFGRVLDRFQARLRRARPGSVMILVVTLLVLMALIGTAYISTARTDRAVVRMYTASAQIDLFKTGVQQMVFGGLANNTFLNNSGQTWDDTRTDSWMASRIPTTVGEACGVWNGLNRAYAPGEWVQYPAVSPRFYVCKNAVGVPALATNKTPDADTGAAGNWYDVTADSFNDPRTGTSGPLGVPLSPATPCWPAVSSPLIPGLQAQDLSFPSSPNYIPSRYVAIPDFIGSLPALWVYDFGTGQMRKVLAASASGDGIADSLMWPLHAGDVNGIEYFASYRVVDGNSALNLNTAGSTYFDYDGVGNPEAIGSVFLNDAIFPGNIGLSELFPMADMSVGTDVSQGRDFMSLNLYRHSSTKPLTTDSTGAVQASFVALRPAGILAPSTTTVPMGDYGQVGRAHARADFLYRTEADAQFMNLGRRIETPGPSAGTVATGVFYAGNFNWNDAAALSYRFDLVNPNSLVSQFTLSTAERVLPDSLLANRSDPSEVLPIYQTSPYTPPALPNGALLAVTGWFNNNYVYEGAASYLDPAPARRPVFNRRAVVVARNPTSNLMPLSLSLYNPSADPSVASVNNLAKLSSLVRVNSGQNWDQMGVPFGSPVPWPNPNVVQVASQLPPPIPRVSLNTASVTTNEFFTNVAATHQPQDHPSLWFQGPSLWFGFYNVMADAFLPQYYIPEDLTATPPRPLPTLYPEQFRSTLRDPAASFAATQPVVTAGFQPHYITARGMLLIRSLIAAVNAAAMRDSADDVNSETVTLRMTDILSPLLPSVNGTVRVTVDGIKRQPFITEVYVNNDTSTPPGQVPDPTQAPDATTGQPVLRSNLNLTANPAGYVAVELYNPYDVAISIAGWTVGILNRDPLLANNPNPYPTMHVLPLVDPTTNLTFSFPAGTIIAARGFLVLDNCLGPAPAIVTTGTRPATYRPFEAYNGIYTGPPAVSVAPTPGIIYVPGLEKMLRDPDPTTNPPQHGGELMLLRPRHANGTPNNLPNVIPEFIAVGNSVNLLPDGLDPVDSFDFTGMSLPPAGGPYQAWHYTRANTLASDTLALTNPPRSSWRMVYPGRWDPTRPIHEEGVTASLPWNYQRDASGNIISPPAVLTTFDPWIMLPPGGKAAGPTTTPPPLPPPALPFATDPNAPITLGQPDYACTAISNIFPPIQLNNTGFNMLQGATTPVGLTHGMNKNFVVSGGTQPGRFPFGGFARVGDVLQVPFIGSYTISVPTAGGGYYILEMNSVTRDAALADDMFPTDDTVENIGKFCSLVGGQIILPPPGVSEVDPTAAPIGYDTYGWTSHILECFTAIHSPDLQYLPHADPGPNDPNSWWTNTTYTDPVTGLSSNFFFKNWNWDPLPPSLSLTGSIYPDPTSGGATIRQPSAPEIVARNPVAGGTAPIEGLVNLNTAPWRVLAAVPWKAPDGNFNTPTKLASYNEAVAKAIVKYRTEVGPFRSLLDLNLVPVDVSLLPGGLTGPIRFQSINGVPNSGQDFDATVGDFTPSIPYPINGSAGLVNAAQTDGLKADAKERFAAITRISNLVTTRSDTFTVYIQVQGWRGLATGSPELIVQRRMAFIVDRSGYPASGYPKVVTNIPTE